MKFLYEAVDGYEEICEWDTVQADEELSGYEMTPYYAISDDGVSKVSPYDDLASAYWKVRFLEMFV